MLQCLVAPVITLAASIWIDYNVFLDSMEQLSHTESLYSSKGQPSEVFIFSRDGLLTLNLRVRIR